MWVVEITHFSIGEDSFRYEVVSGEVVDDRAGRMIVLHGVKRFEGNQDHTIVKVMIDDFVHQTNDEWYLLRVNNGRRGPWGSSTNVILTITPKTEINYETDSVF